MQPDPRGEILCLRLQRVICRLSQSQQAMKTSNPPSEHAEPKKGATGPDAGKQRVDQAATTYSKRPAVFKRRAEPVASTLFFSFAKSRFQRPRPGAAEWWQGILALKARLLTRGFDGLGAEQ